MPENNNEKSVKKSTGNEKSVEVKKQKSGKTKMSTGKNNQVTVKVKEYEFSV